MASAVVVVLTHSLPWRPTFPLHSLSRNSSPSFSFFHSRPSFSTHYHRWDSNAETSRRFGFDFKRKPKDEDEEEDDDDDEEEEKYYRTKRKKRRWWSDEFPATEEGPGGTSEDFLDAFWIFKILKPYGWILPILLISPLLATGPKAFLMALAIPLGQSALALAVEKLWGGSQSRPKRRRRMRKKQPSVTNTDIEEDKQEPGKAKMGYQSWVVGNEGSVGKEGQRGTTFGGWDDLERVKSAQRQSRRKGGTGTMETEKGKLSRRERRSDTPLLLRLLIGFFPFLGSWTKMLW